MTTIRCFVAVECPKTIKDEVQRVQDELRMAMEGDTRSRPGGTAQGKARPDKGAQGIRWVRREGFHLTLKFLGNVAEMRIPEIVQAVGKVTSVFSPFPVEVEGAGAFPSARDPRVIWIGIRPSGDDLARLQRGIDEGLEVMGFSREARPFHPHLTLGRRGGSGGRRDRPVLGDLAKWLAENERRACGRFEVGEVLVMKSDLKPEGAVYTPLATLGLKAREEGSGRTNHVI